MSAGPLEVYNGTIGVANTGGDSLTEDLNIYFSVRTPHVLLSVPTAATGLFVPLTRCCVFRAATLRGS